MTKTASRVAPVVALVAAIALSLAVATSASAATFSNVTFSNGDVTISGQGGSTVNATFKVTVGAGETLEWVRTTVGAQPFEDVSVGGALGLQEGTYDVTVPVKLPPNTGTYTLNVQGAGIYGGIRSINGNDNVVGSNWFGSAVRVVASSSTDSVGGSDMPSWLAALLAALKPATPPAPTVSTACANFALKSAGAVLGTTNSANVKLQGFLLSEGASIPALAAGAAFGFYGPQTASAVAWFNGVNHCN